MPLDIQSTTAEKVHIKLAPDGKLDGVPTWTIDAPATVEPDADGMGAFMISADDTGQSNWSVSADVDLGEGVTTITDGGAYSYNHPQATSLGVTADAPVPK